MSVNTNAPKVLSDIEYDKLKLLYTFSKVLHFINHHAIDDAKNAHDEQFHALLQELKEDIEAHISAIRKISQ